MRNETGSPRLAAPLPIPSLVDDADTLTVFSKLSEDDVRNLISGSSKKCCVLDPIPMRLLIGSLDVLLPVITSLVNSSLCMGHFPTCWKSAVVLPLLKKPGLDLQIENF